MNDQEGTVRNKEYTAADEVNAQCAEAVTGISLGFPLEREERRARAAVLALVAATVSLMGFFVENIFIALTNGYMDNRNMILPFLFGYGISILVLYALYGTPEQPRLFRMDIGEERIAANYAKYFTLVFLTVSLGEIILGSFVERAFGIIWWDYTDIPLHFTRYTSIPTSLGFALLISFFMQVIFEPLCRLFSRLKRKALIRLASVITVILSLDFLNSALYMLINHKLLRLWSITF